MLGVLVYQWEVRAKTGFAVFLSQILQNLQR